MRRVRRHLPLGGRVVAACLVGGMGAMALTGVASAYWTAPGSGVGRATDATLLAPGSVKATASPNSTSVHVTWTASQTDSGRNATGYYVVRIRDSDASTFAACGTTPVLLSTAPACDDLGVVDGKYHYLVTAVLATWTARSTSSASVNVVADTGKPILTVTSISPAPNANGWVNTAVVVNLSASTSLGISTISYSLGSLLNVLTHGSTVSVPVSAEGVNTISVYATDLLGNVSQTQTVVVRIDRVAPAAPSAPSLAAGNDTGSSATDGITSVTTPVFTGTAESGATVTLYDGSAAVGTGIATGGAYVIKSSTLGAGAHTITARASDLAGNVGPASPGTPVTIDSSAPPVPSAPVLSPASDSGISSSDRITNVTTPVFTGTTEAGAGVTLYSAAVIVGTTTAAADGTWRITSDVLKTGPTAMTVRATDAAGNVGAASAATTVTIDYTAPNAPGTPVLAAAGATPTISGAVTPGSSVTLYDGRTVIASVYAAGNTYSVTTSTLTPGAHTITATATDAAGNISVTSLPVTITVGAAGPPAQNRVAPGDAGNGAASGDGAAASGGGSAVSTAATSAGHGSAPGPGSAPGSPSPSPSSPLPSAGTVPASR